MSAMNDDWRVVSTLREDGLAHQLAAHLDADELEHDLEHSFHDRVIVSVDGPTVFCYTGSREQAERALELIRQVAAQHGWPVELYPQPLAPGRRGVAGPRRPRAGRRRRQ